MGAVRAVEELRILMGALMIADVRAQVMLSLFEDFEKLTIFRPNPRHEKAVNTMLEQVISWGLALRPLRKDD
jgi:NAD(P)H-dependent FMN reductase